MFAWSHISVCIQPPAASLVIYPHMHASVLILCNAAQHYCVPHCVRYSYICADLLYTEISCMHLAMSCETDYETLTTWLFNAGGSLFESVCITLRLKI